MSDYKQIDYGSPDLPEIVMNCLEENRIFVKLIDQMIAESRRERKNKNFPNSNEIYNSKRTKPENRKQPELYLTRC